METSYKEKYEQALAKAKEQYNYPCMRSCMGILEEIFPELVENKDEMIRKALKQYFVNSFQNNGVAAICGVHVKDVLAWLEKQGQVKESTISQHEIETCKENVNSLTSEDEKVRKALLEMVHDTTGDELWIDYNVHKEEALAWLERQGEQIDIANKEYWRGYREGKKLILDKYAEIEKQGKQQVGYTTIVETGDGGINALVTRELPTDGKQKPADTVEPKFKVGDKIYLKPEYRMPNDDTPIANTVKEIRRIDDKHYRFDGSYIFIEDQDKYELVEQKLAENAKPQSSTPMSYGKELEKRMYEACNRFFAPNTDSNRYSASDLFYAGVKAEHDLNTLAWSEEDERVFDSVIGDILSADTFIGGKETASYKIDWLKSLKDRVGCEAKCTTTKEWSEEDEEILRTILSDGIRGAELDMLQVNWLKSLRPQNYWKPNDEQIRALKHAFNDGSITFAEMEILATLYEGLKSII